MSDYSMTRSGGAFDRCVIHKCTSISQSLAAVYIKRAYASPKCVLQWFTEIPICEDNLVCCAFFSLKLGDIERVHQYVSISGAILNAFACR